MTAVAGQITQLTLNFFNQTSGVLTDPTGAITLDVTYGSMVGLVPDYTGPFTYGGGSTPSSTQIYRISTGVYAFQWQIPGSAQQGVYVANWSVVFGANTFLVTEDFPITGGFAPAVGVTDTGYWTGSLDYAAPWGDVNVQLGAVDANGTSWLLKKVDGWDSAPAVGAVPQRAGDHGGWATQQWYGPRIITLTVLASAQTQALRDVARATLQQVVPVNDMATLTYNEPVPKQLMVRRNGGANITETCPTLTDVEFVIPLVAPDPRKYGTQTSTVSVNATGQGTGLAIPATVPFTLPAQLPTGSTMITNAGTFESRPVVTITGPVIGPGVSNLTSGQAVTYSNLTLGQADVLVIDFNSRMGFLNGAFRPADMTSAWWTLWPVPNFVQLSGITTGGGALSVAWRPSWM